MKLKQMLKDKDLKASQLARRLKVSESLVWKWCNDKSKPDISFLPQIAQFLSISSDEVIALFN